MIDRNSRAATWTDMRMSAHRLGKLSGEDLPSGERFRPAQDVEEALRIGIRHLGGRARRRRRPDVERAKMEMADLVQDWEVVDRRLRRCS